jgi:hypothetical protein
VLVIGASGLTLIVHERARERAELTDAQWQALQVPPLKKSTRRLYYVAGTFAG